MEIFFVLKGLVNGEEGMYALTCGFNKQMPDGWYFQSYYEDDGIGPFISREESKREIAKYVPPLAK